MALGIYFEVKGMSAGDYQAVHDALAEVGQAQPEGRSFHAGFQVGDEIQVFDVWESDEAFAAFGDHLMPILAERGIDPGEPRIGEIAQVIDAS
jgi:hypothetical protein